MIAAITTRATAGAVTALLQQRGDNAADVHSAEPGQGPALLAGLARTPTDLLLLDVGAGASATDVARFRILQPQARIILLAPGRQPGDRQIAQICAGAEVRDVCADLERLGETIDHPADFASALRWRDPSLAPDPQAPGGPGGAATVIERRVAVGTHPVIITVSGVDRGVGTTTVAAAVAAYPAHLGHDTALVELGDRGMHILAPQPKWAPHLHVYPAQGDALSIIQMRQYPYIVVDAGTVSITDEAAVLPGIGVAPDLQAVVLPAASWRYKPADAFLRRWAYGTPLPALVLDGVDAQTYDQVRQLIDRRREERQLGQALVLSIPPLVDPRDMPPGLRTRIPALDDAMAILLRDLLPDAAPAKRRGLFSRR